MGRTGSALGVCAWAMGAVALLGSGCARSNARARGELGSGVIEPVVASAEASSARASLTPAVATRSGSALARSPSGDALVLADEDHDALRTIRLPVDVASPPDATAVAGHPAQVVALDDRVLVTLRDPGALAVFRRETRALVEIGRVALPADAWGLAVSADLRTAIVTSAWTHRVSAVDLDAMRVRWTVNVAREPRGVAITPNGVGYVTHLVGAPITRIDDLAAQAPRVSTVELPAAPLRTPLGRSLGASLGYAAVLSPDGDRLFAPRMALGAQTQAWWFGEATVDVLLTGIDTPLAPARAKTPVVTNPGIWDVLHQTSMSDVDGVVPIASPGFVQPRAAAYRASTKTLLVAGEGDNVLAELDARALDPALKPLRTYSLGKIDEGVSPFDPGARPVVSGGAPTAIALSPDETMAYVFCRSTYDLMIVRLDAYDRAARFEPGPIPFVHLADDPLGPIASAGRKLFYDATDRVVSGGFACAGCHPEGRDDGHVWHEIARDDVEGGYRAEAVHFGATTGAGFARQTPMLAGRVADVGPYGWHGKSAKLEDRVRAGFGLHHWGTPFDVTPEIAMSRPKQIAAFLREGLVPPPSEHRELDDEELRGKRVFDDPRVGCAGCHEPARGFTDRSIVSLKRRGAIGFDEDPEHGFKTPSLLYVGGTAPYFHDGQAKTLEQLVAANGKTMGNTAELTDRDRTALVAYLYTLGGFTDAPAEAPKAPLGELPQADDVPVGARPSRAEWTTAVRAVKPRDDVPCWVERLGDFAHVRCDADVASSIELLAGDARGVETWTTNQDAHMVFPVRRGDRRIVQITSQIEGGRWEGWFAVETRAVLEEAWLPKDAEPTFVLR